jgi:hypothetical protein
MPANVKIKIRGASAWEQIHPETNLDQITDISTAGKNIAKLANPGAEGLLMINSAGVASVTPTGDVRVAIGAAATSHPHIQSDITNLVSTLAAKADLAGGKIISTQIPDWMIGGLKYAGSHSTPATLTIDDNFRTAYGMSDDVTTKGRYVIMTTVTCSVTLAANHVFMTGDEGDIVTPITLEQGDWIVYRGKNGVNYEFDVVNNMYQNAATNATGVVRLTDGSVKARAALANSSDPLKVVDEYALREAMKGIYYETSEGAVATPLLGDLLFEIEA